MENAPLPGFVFDWANRTPAAEAVVAGDARITYRDLANRVATFRDNLIASGLRPGSRVAHLGRPGPEFLISALATQAAGGVWLGLNPKHTASELHYVLEDAAPSLVVMEGCTGEFSLKACHEALDSLEARPATIVIEGALDLLRPMPGIVAALEAAPEGVALIVYTSGTTGKPKGACLTHRGIAEAARLYADRYGHPGLRSLLNLPINHVGSLIDIVSPSLSAGGRLITMPGFEPQAIPALMREERITILGQVPAMHLAIEAAAPYDPESLPFLRHLVWSGAAMPRSWIEARHGGRVELSTCYGQTEATGSVTFTRAGSSVDELADTVGLPPMADMLRIVGEDGASLAAYSEGEVEVRGRFVMHGYFGRPDATASAFTSDGWLRTGDLGVLDAGGALRLVGRKTEMFKSGGFNVYPREVEIAIEAYPGVDAAAVLSVSDPQWQEVGWAFVLTRSAIDEQALFSFLRGRLANYKLPKRLIVRAELPLLPIGKIDKQRLRREIQDDPDVH